MKPLRIHKKKRRTIAIAVCLSLVSVGLLGWLLRGHEALYASSTADRRDTEDLFRLTWKQYLNETPSSPTTLPGAPALPSVHVLRYPRGTLIQMRRHSLTDHRFPTPVRSIQADTAGVAQLPGNATLRLAAVALSVPAADDPANRDDPATQQLLFREPEQLSELNAATLDEIGIPPSARKIIRAKRWTPMLRLVFIRQGLAFERISSWRAFDARTHGNVTEYLERINGEDVPNNLAILDLHLDIWHDAPIVLAVELPCGTPAETPLQLSDGYQIKPVPHANFQILAAAKGPLSNAERGPDQIYLETESDEDLATVFAYRVFPSAWAQHMGLRVRRGDDEVIRPLIESELALTHAPWPRDQIDDISLLHYPERARAIFRLDALPEMPNSRRIRNLFDVRMPRINLTIEGEMGESSLTYLLLDTVAGATETAVDSYGQNPSMTRIKNLQDRRFVNVSPRELIAEYQARAADPYVSVSGADHIMRFHRPEPWRHRVEQWWYLNKPEWLGR